MNTAKEYRNIIEIQEDLCNGCGQCVTGCAEGALAIIDGKAKLVSEVYCDGLGACLGECPTGALKVIQREAPPFNEEAAMAHVEKQKQAQSGQGSPASGGCPGSAAQMLKPLSACPGSGARLLKPVHEEKEDEAKASGLAAWPIQMKLVSPQSAAFDKAVLILAADCTAFAGPAFHQTFLTEGYPLIIACPKLDDVEPYIAKLAAIVAAHPSIREIRVPMMSVPCCGGLNYIATQALKIAGRESEIKLRTWIVTPEGQVAEEHIR